MKIGYVLDNFPKRSETFVLNELLGLSLKHDVTVFALGAEVGLDIPEHITAYYPRKRLSDHIHSAVELAKGALLERNIYEAHYHSIAGYFARIAKREGIEVLHKHFATNSVIHYMAHMLNIPYTLTTHAMDIFSLPRYSHLETLLRNASRICTISNFNREFMSEHFGLERDGILVVRMGIDVESFLPMFSRPGCNSILSVGRFVRKKGFETAIRAVALLKPEYPELQYRIIGGGPMESDLRTLAHELSVDDNVHFLGNLSSSELRDEYSRASVFILPCTVADDNDMDGIPVVLMEAMAMQKLVISTSISGIPELVQDGKTGLVVEPKEPKSLSNAIARVLDGNVDVERIGRNARLYVQEEFNMQKQIDGMETIFEDVLSR
ncbi:MAG: glycosyltransferase [Thermoplasmata archaeon]|nr:glycosyltransferase [Thermoplasmata archaeon]